MNMTLENLVFDESRIEWWNVHHDRVYRYKTREEAEAKATKTRETLRKMLWNKDGQLIDITRMAV